LGEQHLAGNGFVRCGDPSLYPFPAQISG